MNKQQAIQSQINEIMDCFDFRKCRDVLNAIGFGCAPFEECDLRQQGRERMLGAVKHKGFSDTGPFRAEYKEGDDEDGKWLRIELFCVIEHWPNDGVTYEEVEND